MGRQVQGRLRRRLGRLPRADVRPAEGARDRPRRRRALTPRPRRARVGIAARRRSGGCTAAYMEVFAGFLSHTDHQIGRLLEFLQRQGELENTLIMVISDNGASAEGGPTGTTNEAQFFNNAPEPLEESLKLIDEIGGPKHVQPLPVGLDVGRQHAVPPLEARDLPRRLDRPVHRLLAEGDQGQGRGAQPVRAHHRHGADRARPARHRAARQIRGVTQAPLHGVSFAHTLDDARGREPQRTPSTSRCSGTASIYHDGWRAVCPWPGPSFAEAGMPLRPADHAGDRCPSSTRRAGSCTTSTRTSQRPRTSPPRTATG